jgi:CBS domain containing-hemolysin-like protein
MQSPFLSEILEIGGLLLLIAINAFFVATEFALVSVRRTRIEELVQAGNQAAHWAQQAIRNLDRTIAATQLGITMAGLALGWVAEPALSGLLYPIVRLFPAEISDQVSRTVSAGLAFALVTFLTVVGGELTPKSIALRHRERTALLVARPIVLLAWIFRPATWALTAAASRILGLIRVPPARGQELVHSVDELKMIVAASAEGGMVEAEEEDMLHAVFDFSGLLVRQVMVPRTEMVAVPAEAPLEEIISLALRHPFTRYPVYDGDLDHVLGVVHLRDLMRARHGERPGLTTARGVMREAIFVPETISVRALLRRFRTRRQHMAIVLDEYGGTAGIVTLEDVLEEIVGEVSDEFSPGPSIQRLPDGSSLVDGLALIDEVNEAFGLRLEDPHYDTIAGFILGRLGRLAEVGDTIEVDGAQFRVEALDGKRIARLTLMPRPSAPDGPT